MPFPAVVDLNELAAGNGGFIIIAENADDAAGFSVSAAGDINDDGHADLIIGAPFNGGESGAAGAGAAYVVFGRSGGFSSPTDLDAVAAGTGGFKIVGEEAGDDAGYSVSAAGDVDGDGIDDLIIGAPFNFNRDGAEVGEGAAYVVFGRADGFASPVDLDVIATGIGGFKIEGADGLENAGLSVSSAGDVNGDGRADLIVGAPFADFPSDADYSGLAYFILGQPRPPDGAPIPPVQLGGSFVTRIIGEQSYDRAGFSVSSAGDVNGDGTGDVIMGAYYNDGGGDQAGAAYVVFGGSGALPSDRVELTAIASGTNGFKIQGGDAYDFSGFSVSEAGDVNGDGVDDLILGAWGEDSGGGDAGAAFVVFGKDSKRGDVFASPVDLTAIAAGTGGFMIQGETAGDFAGYSVSDAGDVNGDGFGDLIVGAPNNSDGGDDSRYGAAYVVFGRDGGFQSPVDLATIATGSGGFKIGGGYSFGGYAARAGFSVSAAGDIDGDGIDDLIVGAPFDSTGDYAAGAAYVIFGQLDPLFTAGRDVRDLNDVDLARYTLPQATRALAGDDVVVLSATQNVGALFLGNDGDDSITGSPHADRVRGNDGNDILMLLGGDDTAFGYADADRIFGGSGNDQLDGSFGDDVVSGGDGNDSAAGDAGNDSVFGGEGNDRLDGDEGPAGSGNDRVVGGDGRDLINGGGGADVLVGGLDQDSLTGGAGPDRFRFESIDESLPGAMDLITDFRGADRVDLSRIDAIPGGADDAFTFVTGSFTAPGQVRVIASGGNTLLQANTVGATGPDFTVVLMGIVPLGADDMAL